MVYTESQDMSLGLNIDDLRSTIKMDVDGLIGVESATEYWGLSTFYSFRTIMLFNDNTMDRNGTEFLGSLFVPDVNEENTVYLNKHTRVTDKEQTVCDMVRYNRHEFHLYETLISAFDEGCVDLERLEKLARGYGIWDKMLEELEQARIAEEEDMEC